MSLMHLRLGDFKRLLAAATDLGEGYKVPKVRDLVKAVRDSASDPPNRDRSQGHTGPFGMFVNPGPVFDEKKLYELVGAIRQAVVNRYGDDYANDLWARINKD